jgi:hypothetical protein
MGEQSQRMQSIIQDLLTLSAIESAPPPEDQLVDMTSLVDKLYRDAIALSAGRHDIHLDSAGQGDLLGAEPELVSALANLVSNAIRYTPAGGTITLIWRISAEGAEFAVQDTGIGIDAKQIAAARATLAAPASAWPSSSTRSTATRQASKSPANPAKAAVLPPAFRPAASPASEQIGLLPSSAPAGCLRNVGGPVGASTVIARSARPGRTAWQASRGVADAFGPYALTHRLRTPSRSLRWPAGSGHAQPCLSASLHPLHRTRAG